MQRQGGAPAVQQRLACGQAAFPGDVMEEAGQTVIFRLFQDVGDCSGQAQRGMCCQASSACTEGGMLEPPECEQSLCISLAERPS